MISAADLREKGSEHISHSTRGLLYVTIAAVLAAADKGEYSTEIDLLNTHEAEKSDFDAVEKMFKARGYNVKRTGTHSMEISW